MSRIGKKHVLIPKGVEVKIAGATVSVKGPKGSMSKQFRPEVKVAKDGEHLVCSVNGDEHDKLNRSLWGLTRSLLANMVHGCAVGYVRELEVQGVGYKVKQEGKKVTFTVGLSHTVTYEPPTDITLKVDGVNKVAVHGVNKELVGQVAADIRAIKPPEHYKGTGIRYLGEKVRIKEGKKLAA